MLNPAPSKRWQNADGNHMQLLKHLESRPCRRVRVPERKAACVDSMHCIHLLCALRNSLHFSIAAQGYLRQACLKSTTCLLLPAKAAGLGPNFPKRSVATALIRAFCTNPKDSLICLCFFSSWPQGRSPTKHFWGHSVWCTWQTRRVWGSLVWTSQWDLPGSGLAELCGWVCSWSH